MELGPTAKRNTKIIIWVMIAIIVGIIVICGCYYGYTCAMPKPSKSKGKKSTGKKRAPNKRIVEHKTLSLSGSKESSTASLSIDSSLSSTVFEEAVKPRRKVKTKKPARRTNKKPAKTEKKKPPRKRGRFTFAKSPAKETGPIKIPAPEGGQQGNLADFNKSPLGAAPPSNNLTAPDSDSITAPKLPPPDTVKKDQISDFIRDVLKARGTT